MATPVILTSVNAIFSGGTSGVSPALNTAAGNLIVLAIHAEKTTAVMNVVSVTDTIGNTYARRKQLQWDGNVPTPDNLNTLELWWTISSGSNASNVITATFANAVDDGGLCAFTVNGHATPSPWDTDPSLPATNFSTPNTPDAAVTGITTSSPNALLIAVAATPSFFSFTAGAIGGVTATVQDGWINGGGSLFSRGSVEYRGVTALQSGISAAFVNSAQSWGIIADAIVDTAGSPPLPRTSMTVIS